MNRALAIVQARMGSTRFPGKVLHPLGERLVVDWVMERLSASPIIDLIVLAIPRDEKDMPLAEHATRRGWIFHKGDEQDVLGRFADVVRKYRPEVVVRGTADNPLIDPEVVTRAVTQTIDDGLDVCSPYLKATYPFGVGAEVARADALLRVDRDTRAADVSYREHIFFWAYNHRDRYRVATLEAPPGLARPEVRVSLDTPEDLTRIEALIDRMDGDYREIDTARVIRAWDELQLSIDNG